MKTAWASVLVGLMMCKASIALAGDGGLAADDPVCVEKVQAGVAVSDRARRRSRELVLSKAGELQAIARAGNPTERLIQAELIHSPWFFEVAKASIPLAKRADLAFVDEAVLKRLPDLSSQQTDDFAMVIFEIMKNELKLAESPFHAMLQDLNLARMVFFDLSPAEVTDKIGEVLKLASMNVVIDSQEVLSQARSRRRITGLVEGGVSLASIAGALLYAYLSNESGPYYSYNIMTALPDAFAYWGGIATASLVGVDGVRRLRDRVSPQIRAIGRIAGLHGQASREEAVDPSMLYIPQDLKERLQVFKDKADAIMAAYKAGGALANHADRFFGLTNEVSELQEELIRTFYTDFLEWMKIYDRNKPLVEERFRQIKEGKPVAPASQQRVVNFLRKSLGEALEAIIMTEKMGAALHQIIMAELERLNSVDVETLQRLEQTTFISGRGNLSVTSVALGQFNAQLGFVHGLINQLNDQIVALRNAEILAITLDMGGEIEDFNQPSSDAPQVASIENLLATMAALDASVAQLTRVRRDLSRASN